MTEHRDWISYQLLVHVHIALFCLFAYLFAPVQLNKSMG
jgi:hypothetical protein